MLMIDQSDTMLTYKDSLYSYHNSIVSKKGRDIDPELSRE